MEDVDFDFFETPRESDKNYKQFNDRPTPDRPPFVPKHGEKGRKEERESVKKNVSPDSSPKKREKRDSYSSDEDRDYSNSGSESETPRYEREPARNDRQKGKKKDNDKQYESLSESSSAYSNSDYSSDESIDEQKNDKRNIKKEKIEIKMPKAHQAWGNEKHYSESKNDSRYEVDKNGRSTKHGHNDSGRRNRNRKSSKSSSDVSDSESDNESRRKHVSNTRSERVKSAKPMQRNRRDAQRDRRTRSSSSHSNNSDITDVSPLDSDEESPRNGRRSRSGSNVQYDSSSSPEKNGADIKLETDKIDLSILMKCMADIDREKQQRLKTNSRRVMFAPPSNSEKAKSNYTFDTTRAKTIERENQRLLNQIMTHMNPSSTKLKTSVTPTRGPKKAVEPAIHRLTPSAVNRMKEQRRIENENMKILQRLNRVRPSSGMSRNEQLQEFEKNATYGIPSGTLLIQGDATHYETFHHRPAHSSMSIQTPASTQRSRPSSAKSNAAQQTPGKRSRPSSAKSNASIRSTTSVRSNASMRSTASKRSGIFAYGVKKDKRPEWDDRFSFS